MSAKNTAKKNSAKNTAKPATFAHVTPPKDAKANFAKALDALVSAVIATNRKLISAFRAACHYLPESADFEGKNGNSIKSQKSFIMSVAKTAEAIEADAAHAMIDAALVIPGRMRENITGVSRQVRALVKICAETSGKDKATPAQIKSCIAQAVKDQTSANAAAIASKASNAAQAGKTASKASKASKAESEAPKLTGYALVKQQLTNSAFAIAGMLDSVSKPEAAELRTIGSTLAALVITISSMEAAPKPAKKSAK